jgi:hypothetical protein
MEKYYRKLIKNYFNSIPVNSSNSKDNDIVEIPTEKIEAKSTTVGTRHSTRRVDKVDGRYLAEEESAVSGTERREVLQKLKRLNP